MSSAPPDVHPSRLTAEADQFGLLRAVGAQRQFEVSELKSTRPQSAPERLSVTEGLTINQALVDGDERVLLEAIGHYLERNQKRVPADVLRRFDQKGLIERD